MADAEREYALGFSDKRRTQGQTSPALSSHENYSTVSALRTRLAAISAGYYTTARLNQMTKNDMVYAVRLADDSAGL